MGYSVYAEIWYGGLNFLAVDDPDMGYPRMFQQKAGKHLAVYYRETKIWLWHHIAATIWQSDGSGDIR